MAEKNTESAKADGGAVESGNAPVEAQPAAPKLKVNKDGMVEIPINSELTLLATKEQVEAGETPRP